MIYTEDLRTIHHLRRATMNTISMQIEYKSYRYMYMSLVVDNEMCIIFIICA